MSSASSNRRLEEILIAALELPPAQREAFIREACAGDASMADRIWKMVREEDFGTQSTESLVDDKPAAFEARRVGAYTLHAPIGTGAFGVVYLASRDDELRRRVAIKFLKPYMNPAQFRAETQYLALLNHPNIVKVFDFGQTNDGEFYCVMEYVEGRDLTSHCRIGRLELRARLELFHTICSAVQAAHRVPLVHRDLKPDNIRVTPAGDPKVLDWGLARLLQQDLALNIKAPTTPGLAAGTWVYASPEQLRGEPVTTATDIYSLGIILYEQLTGGLPFVREGMSLAEFTQAAMQEQPPPPSKASLSSASAAEMRLADARALARKLGGELDAIVLMALRKEPDRRYASVEALAADIQAFLNGFPVTARADSLAYRTRKMISRHRALAAMSCLAFVSLTGGLAGSIYQERKANAARQAAEAARGIAEDRTHRMQLESAALEQALDALLITNVPTLPQLTRVEAANAEYARSPENPAARTKLAAALEELYKADEKARDFTSALAHCRLAVQVQENNPLRAHCQSLEARIDTSAGLGAFAGSGTSGPQFDALGAARNYMALGKLLAAGGNRTGAREAFNRAVVLFGLALRQNPDSAEARQGMAQARADRPN